VKGLRVVLGWPPLTWLIAILGESEMTADEYDDDYEEQDELVEVLRFERFSDVQPVPCPVPYVNCSQQDYRVEDLK
jgi:hypothetical protein